MMKLLDFFGSAALCFAIILCVIFASSALADESEDYNRFFDEPKSSLRRQRQEYRNIDGTKKKSKGTRHIRGSSQHDSAYQSSLSSRSNIARERILQDAELPNRKVAPPISKDQYKFPRRNWRENLVLSHSPSSMPSEFVPSESPSHLPTHLPSEIPSMSPTTTYSPTINDTVIPGQLIVGAYYYPWHADDFHKGYGYLREHLVPPQLPELGEYDDRNPRVIWQHLRWSRQANINLWITSWWGPNSRSDLTTRTHILEHEDLRNHRISAFYETRGRIRESENYSLQRVASDMEHLCNHFFHHPNYYTVNDVEHGDRPVLFVYLSRSLDRRGFLAATTELMRQSVRDACSKEVYIVGDQVYGKGSKKDFINNEEDYSAFQLLDGVTNYDVYGNIGQITKRKGGILRQAEVQNFYETEQASWKEGAERYNCQFIPSVSAGYNDLGVRPSAQNPPLSRSLAGREQGSLFKEALKYAVALADNSGLNSVKVRPDRLLVVNSFNEWNEDTQIEPTVGIASSIPSNYTFGFTYEGYGKKYLEILKDGTDNNIFDRS